MVCLIETTSFAASFGVQENVLKQNRLQLRESKRARLCVNAPVHKDLPFLNRIHNGTERPAEGLNLQLPGAPTFGGVTAMPPGEQRFRMFYWIVSHGLGIKFLSFQRNVFRCMAASLAEAICREDWARCCHRLTKEFRFPSVAKQAIISAPRRFGKTWIVAAAQIAFALVSPGSTQATFATSQRASNVMRDTVRKLLIDAGPEFACLITTRGHQGEQIQLRPIFGNPDDLATCNFFPANPTIRTFPCSLSSRTVVARWIVQNEISRKGKKGYVISDVSNDFPVYSTARSH